MEIEKELGRIREPIESLSAQVRVMENQIAYSTLEVALSVQPEWVLPKNGPSGRISRKR